MRHYRKIFIHSTCKMEMIIIKYSGEKNRMEWIVFGAQKKKIDQF